MIMRWVSGSTISREMFALYEQLGVHPIENKMRKTVKGVLEFKNARKRR